MSGTISPNAVDASIPLRAALPAQQNPLAQAGETARTIGAFNELKLFPLQMQAAQLGVTQRNNAMVFGSMVPLLADPNLTMERATQHLGGLEGSGVNTQPIIKELTAIPYAPNTPEWQRAVRTMIASRAQINPEAMVAQAAGVPADINTGQELLSGVRAPAYRGGGFVGATRTPIVPSVSDLATPVYYMGPDNKEVQTTKGEYAARRGVSPESLGPVVSGQRMPGLNEPLSSGGGGAGLRREPPQLPTEGGNTGAPKNTRAQLTTTEGPSPGTKAPLEASGEQFSQARTAAGSFQNRVFPLQQASRLLDAPGADTGEKSEFMNKLRNFAVSMNAQGLLPNSLTPDKIRLANYEELKKYFSQGITGMPFAAGSDAKMAQAISGNPNVNMSTLANKELVKTLIGMERYRQAQYLSFMQKVRNGDYGAAAAQDPNLAAPQFAGYVADFNNQYDPRAFAFDMLDKEGKRRMASMIGKDGEQRFRQSVEFAHTIPGLMQ